MKKELEERLAEEFPFMRKRISLNEQMAAGAVTDLYSAYGCENRNGWYELLRGLCREITEIYEKYGCPVELIPDQVKEKYGTLRFYYSLPSADDEIHKNIAKEIREAVVKYERLSGEVCEECGKSGKLHHELPYICVLCDDCYRNTIIEKYR